MEPIEIAIELAKLLVAIIGAIGVAWFWNREKDRLERYQYFDKSYSDILEIYFQNPRLGRPELAARYSHVFEDDEAWRYHYFALRVHTFLESIFDLSGGKVPVAWRHIYRHQVSLHSAWLRNHPHLHDPRYFADAINGLSAQSDAP